MQFFIEPILMFSLLFAEFLKNHTLHALFFLYQNILAETKGCECQPTVLNMVRFNELYTVLAKVNIFLA